MTKNKNKKIISDFIALQELYPPLFSTQIDYPTVKSWLMHIKTTGFDETMMHQVTLYVHKLQKKEKFAEASLLLLVSVATEDSLSNYMLARELFLGKLFKKNDAAAFGILSALAQKEYPEAVCDMGYFYKNGIVVQKDKKQAKKYYQLAASLGVKRAKKSLSFI